MKELRKGARYVGAIAAVVLAYVVLGKIGLLFAFLQSNVSAVWAPTGIAIAVLLLLGYRLWPAIFIGAFVTNIFTTGTPLSVALMIAIGNTLEALVAVYLVRRFANGTKAFDKSWDVLKYSFFAGVVGTMIGALIGATALYFGGLLGRTDYLDTLITWWLGDMGGALLVAPLLILWINDHHLAWNRKKIKEATLLALTIIVFGWLIVALRLIFLFVFMTPILIWIAFRFDRRIMATVLFIMTEVYVGELLLQESSVATVGLINTSIVLLQAFMATTFVTMMTLATSITERKGIEDDIRFRAAHDSLTGLPNRKSLEENLERELKKIRRDNEKLAVLYLDIDRFKQVNDVFGHNVGDVLLKEFATRIRSCLTDHDMIARLGGDEFCIVLTNVKSTNDVTHIAKNIMKSLEPPVSLEARNIFLSTSIGIAMFPRDGIDIWTLVAASDVALLDAKRAGRAHYSFYKPSMNKEALSRMNVVQELRTAVQMKQIEVYYQPVVDIHTRRILNLEALLRWHHPEKGLIPASEFIPIAEDHGVMRMLGEEILSNVFKRQFDWQKKSTHPLRVAVNLSPREFTDAGFVEKLKRMLLENQIPPSLLELEVVENLAMENIRLAKERFKALRKLGITICIDDFGIGHSSLSYLKNLPIDKLKIDQSFVQHCTTNPQDAAIIQTIVTLGHTLNLKVIAEGVETEDQLQLLKKLGCDGVQGFHIARPITGDELIQWASRYEPIL